MKKIPFILSLSFILFSACSTSKQARSYKKTVNGTWQLQTVVSEGITGKIKAQVFNEADFNCFVGSTWHFNSNNSLGNYSISKNGEECAAIKREIRWSVYEEKDKPSQFQFKRLNDKLQELDENGGGFRFTIVQLDNAIMKLKSEIMFEGKPASFTYNFIKN